MTTPRGSTTKDTKATQAARVIRRVLRALCVSLWFGSGRGVEFKMWRILRSVGDRSAAGHPARLRVRSRGMVPTENRPEPAERSVPVPSSPLPAVLVGVLFLALVLWLASRLKADPDLWGHVRFGLDTLAGRAPGARDTYSFTSDRPWINHEWLAEVVVAASYRLGAPGLILLAAAVMAGTVALVGAAVRRGGLGGPAGVVLVALAVYGASPQLATVRPQLFSVLLCAALLWVLRAAQERPSAAWLAAPLFAAWANLHGGWIVGLGVLGLWLAGEVLRGAARVPRSLAVLACALVATAVNPYGARLWGFLAETVGPGRADIEEWQPVWRSPADLLPWMACALALGWAWWRSRRSRWEFLPAIALGALTFQVVRLQAFFALSTVACAAPAFAGRGAPGFPLTKAPTKGEVLLVAGFAAAVLGAAGVVASRTADCLPLMAERVYATPEAEAVEFLSKNRLEGRMLTWFDYGQYALWHLSPRLKVSYDGRRETVYSTRVQQAHWRFYRGDTALARQLQADFIWVPASLPVVASLLKEGWVCIFRGPRSVVFAAVAGGTYVQPGPFTGPRCFPGP
jgi:hypothetical protein